MQDQAQNNATPTPENVTAPVANSTATPVASPLNQTNTNESHPKLARFLRVFKWITLFFVIISLIYPVTTGVFTHSVNDQFLWPILGLASFIASCHLLKKGNIVPAFILMLIAFALSFLAVIGIVILLFLVLPMMWQILFILAGGGH